MYLGACLKRNISTIKKGIWISWETQRRNKGIASALGWQLFEFDIIASPIRRYAVSLYKTVTLIIQEKPDFLAAQNPSIVLSVWVAVLKHYFGFLLILDAHNSGIRPRDGKSKFLMWIARWLQKEADLTIVTNPELKKQVDRLGGRAICLPDKLPEAPISLPMQLDGAFSIAFICTFSGDEPFMEVLSAARLIPSKYVIYITGKYSGKINTDKIPQNVRLIGFVPDLTFWELLNSAHAIMDLTLREDCLVCGAYEGVAVGKPLILSNTRALRTYFNKGSVYVDPTAESIAQGISFAAEKRIALQKEIQDLKIKIESEWQNYFLGFKQYLQEIIAYNKR